MSKEGYQQVLEAVEKWPAEKLARGVLRGPGDCRCAVGCSIPDRVASACGTSLRPAANYLGLSLKDISDIIRINDGVNDEHRKDAVLAYLRKKVSEL